MSKRIGYVGLSTPLFYDRMNSATRTDNDVTSSPNPILDGAIGAMLLYDEIWFLCRSLCPENMRNLEFVRFLDEEGNAPDLGGEQKEIDKFWSSFDPQARKEWSYFKVNYDESRRLLGLSSNEIYTATLNLRINGFLTRGTSHNYAKLFMDVRAVAQLPANVELITNRISSTLLRAESRASSLSTTASSMIFRNVSEYLDRSGPYHPFVKELRESYFLSDFRTWLMHLGRDTPLLEIAELQAEIDAKLEENMRKAFLKSLNPSKIYKEAAVNVIGAIGGALFPVVGAVAPIVSLVRSYGVERDSEPKRWQGFLVEAEAKARSHE